MVRRAYNKEKDEIQSTLIPIGLPEVFRRIYYSLYSNSNIPRAERLGAEMTRLLFCKIYDEMYNENPEFRIRATEDVDSVAERVRKLFGRVKDKFPDAFDKTDKLYLDNKSIAYVVGQMQVFKIHGASRDVISESFQAFLGPGLRGEKGQFFTPRNVVKMCVDILNPKVGERIIDPACGSGGFLVECVNHLAEEKGNHEIGKDAFKGIFGIDKECDLERICKAYMMIVGDGHSNIFCSDSLSHNSWANEMQDEVKDESFDVVLTNPPFGARIAIGNRSLLENFQLGHKWERIETEGWKVTKQILPSQAPQILFLERCLQLLKPGGRMAIVLPDGVFGNPRDKPIIEFIFQQAKVMAIVSLSPEAFLPGTHTKTSVLFLEKKKGKNLETYDVFMGIANKVGHDKNGNTLYKMNEKGQYLLDEQGKKIIDDDLPEVAKRYEMFLAGQKTEYNHLGFTIEFSRAEEAILIPSYYDPEIQKRLKEFGNQGYDLLTLSELVKRKVISIKRGNEVGSRYYGMGAIPFVRTSDIVNWEIKIDPVKSIPEEIYNEYKHRQDIKENDILLIADGTFLIGRTAIVTKLDTKIVIQSHIRRIRCLKTEILDPYVLMYLLNTDIVQRQMRAKTFVQATISTIGNRLNEIVLPIPKDKEIMKKIKAQIGSIIELKMTAREKINEIFDNGENPIINI
jgi:type I restriction enzyme M protein